MISFISTVTFFLVITIIILRLMNKIRFVYSRNSHLSDFNYIGEWNSKMAPVSGRILVKIPYPLPENQQFEIDSVVYYNLFSLFRSGQFVPMKLEGLVTNQQTSSGSNSETPIVIPPTITFKSKVLNKSDKEQKIEYVSTFDKKYTTITGGYLSESPFDIGVFSLRKVH